MRPYKRIHYVNIPSSQSFFSWKLRARSCRLQPTSHSAFLYGPTAQYLRSKTTCFKSEQSRSSCLPRPSDLSRPFARGIGFLAPPPTSSSPSLPPSRRERRPEKRKKKKDSAPHQFPLPYRSTLQGLIRQNSTRNSVKC